MGCDRIGMLAAALCVACSSGPAQETGSLSADGSTGSPSSTTTDHTADTDDAPHESSADASSGPAGSSTGGPEPTGEGSSDTGAPPNAGPLVVDDEHVHFYRRAGGDPFFLCGPGDPEDFLHRGVRQPDGTRDGDQDELLAKLAPTGANTILFQAVRSHGGDGDATHNPFVDNDPALGLDEVVLDQWDGWLTAMNEAGIVPVLFLYDDLALVWDTGDVVEAPEQAFVEALVDRFEHHDLLVWGIAERYSAAYSAARVSALAAVVQASDDSGHPITSHQTSGLAFDFPDDPAIDSFSFDHAQASATSLHDGIAAVFPDARDHYNLTAVEIWGHGTGEAARAVSWAAATSGAYVMVFEQTIADTDVADLEDCGRIVEFFESVPFNEMSPHDELAADDTSWVFARPAEAYVLFGQSSPGALGLADLPGATWALHWLDPAAGTTVDATLRHNGGPVSLPVPEGFGTHAALSLMLSRP